MRADFEFVTRREVRRTDDFLFELDEYRRPSDGTTMLIAHMRVFRWAPSVLKQMRREFALFRTVCRDDIYASPVDDEPKWHKFVKALGYRFLKNVICNDGKYRPLYLSRITDGDVYLHNQHQPNRQHQ